MLYIYLFNQLVACTYNRAFVVKFIWEKHQEGRPFAYTDGKTVAEGAELIYC